MIEKQVNQPVEVIENNKKRFTFKKIIIWVVLLGLVTAGLVVNLGLTGALVVKRQSKVLLDQLEKPELGVKQVSASESEAVYELIEGWNLVSFPVKPVGFNKASDLIVDVAQKGGYVTVVSAWDGDKWIELAQRGQDQFGHDFTIEPGKAYFLKNQKAVTWRVKGEPVGVADLREYRLEKGWNTIGLLDESDRASTVIDKINLIGASSLVEVEERATVMDWWTTASNWELFIKRIYSGGKVQEYGENFAISNTKGYMIYL